jgi:hypothetical protein
MDNTVADVYLYLHGGNGALEFYNETMNVRQIQQLYPKTVKGKVFLFSCHGGGW